MPLDRGSNGAQSRLNKAVAAHEKASQEVERLMDLVENAIEALSLARKTKQQAQRELDSAALEAKREIREIAYNTSDSEGEDEEGREWSTSEVARRTGTGDRRAGAIVERSDRYEESDYSSASEESVEFDEDEESDPDDNGFDLGDSAVEQIRYRLDNAKIDLTGPEGTQVLDKLLLLLQASNEPDIDENVVNDIIDEVLCVGGEHDVKQGDTQTDDEQPRIRINRGNKVLGWYEGALDARGYAREGKGSSKISRLVVFTFSCQLTTSTKCTTMLATSVMVFGKMTISLEEDYTDGVMAMCMTETGSQVKGTVWGDLFALTALSCSGDTKLGTTKAKGSDGRQIGKKPNLLLMVSPKNQSALLKRKI